MNLEIEIRNVKSIKQLKLSLPLEKGLYAITGENSSGKSTFVSCASTVFFNAPMIEYFGQPSNDSKISFKIGNASRLWFSNNGKWWRQSSGDKMEIPVSTKEVSFLVPDLKIQFFQLFPNWTT